ncbi:Lysophosphatidic acid phosphatase type 6 [Mortierella antarctica]|nr:Lysophosphatidic acid phosphatase type 6 [Mortierella antarctica]
MYRDAEGIFEVLQLGIGPLAQEIKRNLVAAKDGTTKVLLSVYSGHDTTLSPLLGMLDSADMRWPPYAANMLMELWKSGSGEHFVRVIYNHKVVETKSGWCDLSWCPLEKFTVHLDRFYVPDLAKQCQRQ